MLWRPTWRDAIALLWDVWAPYVMLVAVLVGLAGLIAWGAQLPLAPTGPDTTAYPEVE